MFYMWTALTSKQAIKLTSKCTNKRTTCHSLHGQNLLPKGELTSLHLHFASCHCASRTNKQTNAPNKKLTNNKPTKKEMLESQLTDRKLCTTGCDDAREQLCFCTAAQLAKQYYKQCVRALVPTAVLLHCCVSMLLRAANKNSGAAKPAL
jgi:hypothetical protein